MGEITHSWNGTILTITSDSGTSSMDLKGDKGDDGARGPQGPAGDTTQGSTVEIDNTLTVDGAAADAYTVGDRLAELQENIDNLTAADVGALPADTVIPSTSGLATETYVDNAVSTAVATKQNKVFYNSSQPADWVSGDIWLKPLS